MMRSLFCCGSNENALKLMLGLGLSVARGGEFAVGSSDCRDADVDGLEELEDYGADDGDAGGEDYYVYFETVEQGWCVSERSRFFKTLRQSSFLLTRSKSISRR